MGYRKVTVKKSIADVKGPWTPIVVGMVEDYEIKLVVFEGKYFWHRHTNHDEFLYVYDGRIMVDFEDKRVTLTDGEGILIEKNTPHRSRATRKSVILVFEKNTIYSDFVRIGEPK
ncbi:MAG: cupin domain-containing protein [Planctomycetota bacterium]|nr:cupin domain-containing protein [Planctomycetota bacterium]